MHKAFKPMVREHAYDASEMALVTYLQAKAYNKGLTLLPAAMLARFQHGTMLFNAERGKLDAGGPAGQRIGVRSYSQTTGGLAPRHSGKRLRRRSCAACSGSPSRMATSPKPKTRPASSAPARIRTSRKC